MAAVTTTVLVGGSHSHVPGESVGGRRGGVTLSEVGGGNGTGGGEHWVASASLGSPTATPGSGLASAPSAARPRVSCRLAVLRFLSEGLGVYVTSSLCLFWHYLCVCA